MKFYSHTLGCRTNQYDTAAIETALANAGIEIVRSPDDADVIYVQTCSVTGRADTKSGQYIRKMVAAYPQKKVLVGGCGPQGNAENYLSIDGVEKVFGVNSASEILSYLARGISGNVKRDQFGSISGFIGRKRAHVKIQDGCDSFCTYCIVPFLRGNPISRESYDVQEQINRLVAQGFAEIVLTGIHIGKYSSNGMSLSDLLAEIVKESGEYRIRLSSIEPNEIDNALLDLVLHSSKICNHLHIPIQSGDATILEAMGRHCSLDDVSALLEKLRKNDPFIGIGTDVITGFPGETDKLFSNTVDYVSRLPFTYGHVFPYSPRKGTPAALLKGQIPRAIAVERARILKNIFEEKKALFMKTLVGTEQQCIIESGKRGHASNYAPVEMQGKSAANGIVSLQINGYAVGYLNGTIKGEQ